MSKEAHGLPWSSDPEREVDDQNRKECFDKQGHCNEEGRLGPHGKCEEREVFFPAANKDSNSGAVAADGEVMNSSAMQSSLYFSAVGHPIASNRNSSGSSIFAVHHDPWGESSECSSTGLCPSGGDDASAAHFADDSIMHSALEQSMALFSATSNWGHPSLLRNGDDIARGDISESQHEQLEEGTGACATSQARLRQSVPTETSSKSRVAEQMSALDINMTEMELQQKAASENFQTLEAFAFQDQDSSSVCQQLTQSSFSSHRASHLSPAAFGLQLDESHETRDLDQSRDCNDREGDEEPQLIAWLPDNPLAPSRLICEARAGDKLQAEMQGNVEHGIAEDLLSSKCSSEESGRSVDGSHSVVKAGSTYQRQGLSCMGNASELQSSHEKFEGNAPNSSCQDASMLLFDPLPPASNDLALVDSTQKNLIAAPLPSSCVNEYAQAAHVEADSQSISTNETSVSEECATDAVAVSAHVSIQLLGKALDDPGLEIQREKVKTAETDGGQDEASGNFRVAQSVMVDEQEREIYSGAAASLTDSDSKRSSMNASFYAGGLNHLEHDDIGIDSSRSECDSLPPFTHFPRSSQGTTQHDATCPEDHNYPLHSAAKQGDVASLRALLDAADIDPNAGDAAGKTPLHCAALSQSRAAACIASLLIAARSDAALRDADWHCALHYASKGGRADVVGVLIQEGQAELESECRGGMTALHMACTHGHANVLSVLLRHAHADMVNHQDQNGRTALHCTCDDDNKAPLAVALIEAGAEPLRADFAGSRPLDIVREAGLVNLLEAMQGSAGVRAEAVHDAKPDPSTHVAPRQQNDQMKQGSHDKRPASTELLRGIEGVDMITGRGEVWVARRLSPDSSLDARDAPEGGPAASVWGLETVVLPPLVNGSSRHQEGHQNKATWRHDDAGSKVQGGGNSKGGAGAFAVWEQAHADVHNHKSRGPRLHESVDLTRSVVDDWIVVDEDEDSYERASAAGRRHKKQQAPNSTVDSVSVVVQETVAEVKKNLRWALDNGFQKASTMWPFREGSESGAKR